MHQTQVSSVLKDEPFIRNLNKLATKDLHYLSNILHDTCDTTVEQIHSVVIVHETDAERQEVTVANWRNLLHRRRWN